MNTSETGILLKQEAEKLFHNMEKIQKTERTEQKEDCSVCFCIAGKSVEMICDRKLLKEYFLWQMGLFRIPDSSVCSYRVNIRSDKSMDPLYQLMDAYQCSGGCTLDLFDQEDPIRLYIQNVASCRQVYAYRESVKEGWTIIDPDGLSRFTDLSTVMTPLFSRMFESAGILLLHSAAVVCKGRAILLPGSSGSAKSTLAAACLLTGMEYISDDTVLLQRSDKKVFPLCTSIHLKPDVLPAFPEFAERMKKGEISIYGKNPRKIHMDISCFRDRIAAGTEAGMVLRPRITGNSFPEIIPAEKSPVTAELLRSSTQLLGEEENPGYRSRTAEEIGRMDCYDFLLSRNIRDNAEYLKAFLEKAF